MRKILNAFFISSIMLISGHAYAEENDYINSVSSDIQPWWVNLGIGVGGSGDMGGATGTISINIPVSQHQLITARYLETDQFLGASTVKDAGILYSLIARQKYGFESASAGLSWTQYDHWVGGIFIGNDHVATYNTIGIPGELQFFLTPISHLGLGLIVFGNLNNRQPFAGAALAFQFGNW